MKKIFLLIVFIFGLSSAVQAGKGHNHEEVSKAKKSHDHDHDDEKEHSNHGHEKEDSNHDHRKEEKKHTGHEEEGTKNVGPNKGVTSFDEEKGFTLSEEARKKFSIETKLVNGNGPWNLPDSALLLSGKEKNIYRLRDGVFKRIDLKVLEKTGDQLLLESTELRSGDYVVIKGVGFIRTAEVDATSGESGHHH